MSERQRRESRSWDMAFGSWLLCVERCGPALFVGLSCAATSVLTFDTARLHSHSAITYIPSYHTTRYYEHTMLQVSRIAFAMRQSSFPRAHVW
jgi:hypothetical protein